MKIVNRITGETLTEIITNHSMTIEEAVSLMQWHINTPEDERDDGVWVEDLEMVY